MYNILPKGLKYIKITHIAIVLMFNIRFIATLGSVLFIISYLMNGKQAISLFLFVPFTLSMIHHFTEIIETVWYWKSSKDTYVPLYVKDRRLDILLKVVLTPISKIQLDLRYLVNIGFMKYLAFFLTFYHEEIEIMVNRNLNTLDDDHVASLVTMLLEIKTHIHQIEWDVIRGKLPRIKSYKELSESLSELESLCISTLESIYRKDPVRRDNIIDSILETN